MLVNFKINQSLSKSISFYGAIAGDLCDDAGKGEVMLILDVLLRYSTVTLLFIAAFLALRDGRGSRISIYIFLVTFTVAAMLLTTVRPELQLPRPIHFTLRFIDMGNIIFIWWLGLAMFSDNFRLRWWHWLVLGLNCAALLPGRIMEISGVNYFHPVANYGLDIITLGIMGHLAYVALKGRSDDLIEPRRRFRLFFVLALVAATLTSVFAENLLTKNHSEFLQTLRCIIVFPMALWGLLWLTKMHPEKLIFEAPEDKPNPEPAIDPRDQQLLTDLKAAMDGQQIYNEPGLTIRALAERLKTPEHRLRSLINSGLGYRNFSSFLNRYRIDAIKAAFAKPENSRIPVLTIALDHGYNSLAPFNRAFRDVVGKTPTQYRQEILSGRGD